MKYSTFAVSALAALSFLAAPGARADTMASVSIAPATGAVTLTSRWSIGNQLAGFHHMSQDLSLGGGANQFYSLKSSAIAAGGDVAAFSRYIAGSGAATAHADIGSKLTPNSYSALTSADPDIGYGAVNFYVIHHKSSGDYFAVIKPSSATASSVTDLKPMSGPGGPATLGASGYTGLAFAAANVGHGLNMFYYLRENPATGTTFFGQLDPGLLNASADLFDLRQNAFASLVFTGSDVGYGTDQFYYLRRDPVTGFTVFGTLNGTSGRQSDIANLGSVYTALTFVPGDVGFGSGKFYVAGATNVNEQSVSFAAIADKAVGQAFTVTPSASSGLAIALTVVPGSIGTVTIAGPSAGVFTVTPTAAGSVTLQATQAGNGGTIESNMLRQRFTVGGTANNSAPVVNLPPVTQTTTAGGTVTFNVSATGTPAPTIQWTFNGTAIAGATSTSLIVNNAQIANTGIYQAVVTNSAGSVDSSPAILSLSNSGKVAGTASEVGSNIRHPNGNIYDQMLLTGPAATINADAGEVARVSFIDLSNDIVQVEFNGPGTLSITLDGATGPATAINYNQPSVAYMKGNARIVVTGATEVSNLAIFSVGKLTAIDQSLFRNDVVYDGVADVASVTVLSSASKFGALRTGNASYFATTGYTGVYAPGIAFGGVVLVGDIVASDTARPVLQIGSATDTRITGGDLQQSNNQAIRVSGVTQLRMVAGTTSDDRTQAAQTNRAILEQNGTDVTAQIVVNP